MATGYQGLTEPWDSRRTWSWGVLVSVVCHALLVAVVIVAFRERPAPPRVVVPVKVVSLVPFKPGPKGGGGGRPAPASTTEAVTQKPAAPPKAAPPIKKPRQPKAKLAPPSELAPTPVIPTPAAASAASKTKPTTTAAVSGRAASPGVSGTGQGGQGGGRGTGSGGGTGPGQGPGSGGGSALQGYLKEVRRLLEKNKDYPWMARRRSIQGVVALVFTIGSGGQIEGARIGRSSGKDLLDEAAQNTLRRVGKFPPFPPELNRQKLTIEVPLAFRLRTE
ncbi:MAG: energy transducer TonB [Desulfobaccales bacterium]